MIGETETYCQSPPCWRFGPRRRVTGDPRKLNPNEASSPSLQLRAWQGLLVGVYAGAVFSLLSFALYGKASEPFLFGARHAIHAYAYTIAIHALLGGIVGAILGVLLWIPGAFAKPLRGRLFWILLLLPFASAIPFVFANASWQIAVPRNVGLYDPYRIAFLKRSVALSLAAGLAVSLVLTLALYGRASRGLGRKLHAVFVLAVVLVAGTTLAQMHLFHGRVQWSRVQSTADPTPTGLRVVLVGLDGATWTVIGPMLDEGKLPNLQSFLEDSAYGPLQVYGKAFSPSVWTTMVTGVRRSTHGIVSYTVSGEECTYMVGSNYRKVPAVWNIVNEAGLAAGMINYMVTYPPEHVVGLNLPRVVPIGAIPYEEKVWPPALIPEVKSVVESVPPATGADDHAAVLNHEVAILEELFTHFWDPGYSFFTVYTHSTDDCEHRYWSFMRPGDFKGTPLEPSASDLASKKDVIADHWERVDGLFERINEIRDPQTVVIVVSDHGMESAAAPEAHLSVNKLLAAMGLLEYRAPAEIDTSKTLAYWPRGSDINMTATGIHLNVEALDHHPEAGRSYQEALAYVMRRLRTVRLMGAGEPLFPAVCTPKDEPDPAVREPLARSDVIVHMSAYTRGARVNDTLDLGGRTIPMADVLAIKTDVTGAHNPRGIIMACGSPFKHGPVFARPTVETPVSDVLERVLGRAQSLDPYMKAAQGLGLLDRATTLDICQTILYLLGLPCADYMQGRVLAEAMNGSFVSDHPGSLVPDYGEQAKKVDVESPPSAEELERLRSLGYVD
jgi:predicted AlkP superfamily phosphohydrolase/phosphomutase